MASPHKPVSLAGIIDMHIHSAPDLRPRAHHDIGLAEQAGEIGARAIVLKSHLFPTVDRAWYLNRLYPSISFFGSVTLNRPLGGINPHAVHTALQLGAKIVWLPTLESARHRSVAGHSGGVETVVSGKVVPALIDVFRLVAEHGAILGTGHLSPEEIFIVVEEARKQGVENIVITHPESYVVRMSVADQRRLVEEHNVLLERVYAQPLGNGKFSLNHEANLRAIEEVGSESTILSTDAGQKGLPPWRDMLAESVRYLAEHGVSATEIKRMTQDTPARLLGLKSN